MRLRIDPKTSDLFTEFVWSLSSGDHERRVDSTSCLSDDLTAKHCSGPCLLSVPSAIAQYRLAGGIFGPSQTMALILIMYVYRETSITRSECMLRSSRVIPSGSDWHLP